MQIWSVEARLCALGAGAPPDVQGLLQMCRGSSRGAGGAPPGVLHSDVQEASELTAGSCRQLQHE